MRRGATGVPRERQRQWRRRGAAALLRGPPIVGSIATLLLLMVALIRLDILTGFVHEIVGRFQTDKPPFPAVVYFHGVVFAGWLCLLTAQVLLIRSRTRCLGELRLDRGGAIGW